MFCFRDQKHPFIPQKGNKEKKIDKLFKEVYFVKKILSIYYSRLTVIFLFFMPILKSIENTE